jgi:uncharacterized protein (DUF885 family)
MGHATVRFVSLADDTRPEPRTPYDSALYRFLDDLFEDNPVWATQAGFHAFDDRWPDVSEAGRVARLAMLRHHRARLESLEAALLSDAEQVDRAIALEAIDAMEFADVELRPEAWDPLSYISLAGSGLFSLLAHDFAPWAHRGAALAGRVAGLAGLLEDARGALTGLPDRPVSRLHTETALKQLAGVAELIAEAVSEADRRAAAGEQPEIAAAMRAAAVVGDLALDHFSAFLRDEALPRSEGEGRLGPALFQARLRHTLATDLPVAEVEARARRDYEVVRAEMVRLARELWPVWRSDRARPSAASEDTPAAADERTVREVLDAISRDHRQPAELLDWCRAEVDRIAQFCRSQGIISLPAEPLKITWTPVFMRAYGQAFLHHPGPLDKGQASHFWITPPDESLGAELVESYLREDNDRMLSLLCIHEAIPGHYLQLARSNQCPQLTRAIFASGTFAEGWAVYVTQVMMDLGYRADDPALMLVHWKFYLRAIINVLLDIGIHTAGMTETEAIKLMVEGGFQEEHEARQKWLRGRLTSTQLSTYYVGSLEMWDLELEARRRAARDAGAGRTAVGRPYIVGGLGQSPGFDYRAHLESVIAHGSPPTRWIRKILLGAAEETADRAAEAG